MKIKWLGHSAFLVTANDGTRIITDPYAPASGLSYGSIDERADIALASHGHGDHANIAAVKGSPQAVQSSGSTKAKGIDIKGVVS